MEHSFNHPTIGNKRKPKQRIRAKPSSITESIYCCKTLYNAPSCRTRIQFYIPLSLCTDHQISSGPEYASNGPAGLPITCPGRGSGPRLSSPQDPSGSTFRARIHISSRHFYPKRSPGFASVDTCCIGAVFQHTRRTLGTDHDRTKRVTGCRLE
jgi:hypothetical protein